MLDMDSSRSSDCLQHVVFCLFVGHLVKVHVDFDESLRKQDFHYILKILQIKWNTKKLTLHATLISCSVPTFPLKHTTYVNLQINDKVSNSFILFYKIIFYKPIIVKFHKILRFN